MILDNIRSTDGSSFFDDISSSTSTFTINNLQFLNSISIAGGSRASGPIIKSSSQNVIVQNSIFNNITDSASLKLMTVIRITSNNNSLTVSNTTFRNLINISGVIWNEGTSNASNTILSKVTIQESQIINYPVIHTSGRGTFTLSADSIINNISLIVDPKSSNTLTQQTIESAIIVMELGYNINFSNISISNIQLGGGRLLYFKNVISEGQLIIQNINFVNITALNGVTIGSSSSIGNKGIITAVGARNVSLTLLSIKNVNLAQTTNESQANNSEGQIASSSNGNTFSISDSVLSNVTLGRKQSPFFQVLQCRCK
ncbi:MAG: hypothetical protein EZS28_048058 [Streblomastix strix]|uniref:Uncharacterized protein n=1 Tax=Streblomastix strix TaxID=222440 RepID=A0A5J4TG26_9EUKA|nr:MAG: hypothetical protein EZS28_048058 [Streblomastix strix]